MGIDRMISNGHLGLAVALAWPSTYCKQAGGWYDSMLKRLGINKSHYYKAGHAAVVLIQRNGGCYYFDFGRYHSPYGLGRVRGANTDPDLYISQMAKWDGNKVVNFEEILEEVAKNPACHGQGVLKSSFFSINFEKALHQIHMMQAQSPIRYGPFERGGTNCSRFVNTVIRQSALNSLSRTLLALPYTITPSPMFNVRVGRNYMEYPEVFIAARPDKVNLFGVIQPEGRPEILNESAFWHAGEGGGSWFLVNYVKEGVLKVARYNSVGDLEFESDFVDPQNQFEVGVSYEIGYLSHFNEVTLIQQDNVWKIFRK